MIENVVTTYTPSLRGPLDELRRRVRPAKLRWASACAPMSSAMVCSTSSLAWT